MKWITHQTVAVATALALGLPPGGMLAACAGAVLPDVLDQRFAGLASTRRGQQRIFNRVHRGVTHWFGWWLTLLVGAAMARISPPLVILAGLGLGGLSHVILDMLTPQGVPLLPFSRQGRLSLKLCSTGSIGEYCFLICIVGATWFFLREDALHLVRRLARHGFF